MRVKVRLFAQYRETAGAEALDLELPEGARVADALAALEERFPGLEMSAGMAAVNANFAKPDTSLRDGDELAFLPPVSGGEGERLFLTQEPLEPLLGSLLAWAVRPEFGASVVFLGTTRSPNRGQTVDHLVYEAYPEMAPRVLAQIAGEMRERWALGRIAIGHRLGRVNPGEASILIVVSSPHRPEAFAAARYAIDRVKQILPVWKKEVLADGSYWVEGGADPALRLGNPAEPRV